MIPATRVAVEQEVFLEKQCPVHGEFNTVIWRGAPSYQDWGTGEEAPVTQNFLTDRSLGCPNDCGLCPDHAAQTCTVLMEVTNRCDLGCPVCFAESNPASDLQPSMDKIRSMLSAVIKASGPCPIQLSGGEPTLRNDLPEIAAEAKKLGFPHVQINTHGLRLARDINYLQSLKEAGADLIYLQFDGESDDVYRQTRGADLLDLKVRAIANCAQLKIGVQLVPTLIPGVNDHQLGDIIQFAKKWIPIVKGVHFQPVSYFGRHPFPPLNQNRITIPEVLNALETQTNGEIKADHFLPRRRRDSHCGFSGFFVLSNKGRLTAASRFASPEKSGVQCGDIAGLGPSRTAPSDHVRAFINEKSRFIEPLPATCECKKQNSLQALFERARTHFLSISGMPFQDAWSIDLQRLQGCCIHVITTDKRLIPFCAYYLTDSTGRRLPGKGLSVS